MKRRFALTLAVAALAALAPAAPAAADAVTPRCIEVNPVPDLLADPTYTRLCLTGDSGVYTLAQRPYCEKPATSCPLIVTAGYSGTTDVTAELCTAAAGQQPLCILIQPGMIQLVPVDPITVCYGWQPWMPPCGIREVDEP
jgi:hypothetical protein